MYETRAVRKGTSRSNWNNQWGKSEDQQAWEKAARIVNDRLMKKYSKQNLRRGIRRELQT